MTADEFLVHEFPDGKVELVRGEPRVNPPAGAPHGVVASNLLRHLIRHVDDHDLGRVFGDGVGYELLVLPHTVRAPDVSFIRTGRMPAEGVRRGFMKMAPDLAVEVLSPSETASELAEKLDDYRAAQTPLIWVIDPERRDVTIMPRDKPVRLVKIGDTLDGDDVLPGFRMAVVDLFLGLAPD
jgi:Uma2 family endonuclease